MKSQWKDAVFPEKYKEINSSIKMPSYNTIVKDEKYQLPTPLDKTYIDIRIIKQWNFQQIQEKLAFIRHILI